MAGFLCPVCGGALAESGNGLRCEKGHCFDKARSGYVNLIPPNSKHAKIPGDSREMVNARRAFLDKGYYAPFAEAISKAAARYLSGKVRPVLLDAGCGEGYYTQMTAAALAAAKPDVLAVDISKFAADKCARRCPEVQCAAASVYHLPLPDGCCDAVMSIFSPYCGEEYQRVLKPGGVFIMGIPGRLHLWELKAALYEEPYENEVKDYLLEGFEFRESIAVDGRLNLPCADDIRSLFTMTPYYYKSGPDAVRKLNSLEKLETGFSFEVLVYQKPEKA